MCGIVGEASQHPVYNRTWIDIGRDAMTHRGPDDAGTWWSEDARVGMAHRRLSILDLSPAAHQPMHDASGSSTIVFNGEIYNFAELRAELTGKGAVFRSHSDTEVILASYREWGTDCLSHFNGMFAFALYDHQRQTLFLARDRAGEKPLFYYMEAGALRFASELKGLLADSDLSRRINHQALDCYLAMGYVPGELCILEGFSKLLPAHAMLFDLRTGSAKVWQYWALSDSPEDMAENDVDDIALLNELEQLLENSVRRQMVADVSVGVLLSGGVDSSLVTAMAARGSQRVKTFSARFPGHGALDETEHARLIARHFDTEHTELTVQPASVGVLPLLARQFDEPMADSSMIPTFMISQLVRQHCTVALGGDGGDELFGGYGHYSRWLRMQHRSGKIPLLMRRGVAISAEKLLPVGLKGRNWLQGLALNLRGGQPFVATYFDATTRRRLMGGSQGWKAVAEAKQRNQGVAHPDLLQRATRMDFRNYLAEDILVKVDRASMLNSLEVRAPFLDQQLIEFAFGKVSSRLKATSDGGKLLLKQLCGRVLPLGFDKKREQGFSIPLHDWLREGPWRDAFREVLLESEDGLFDRDVLGELLAGQDRGRANSGRLFALVMFELWRKEYRVGLS